jgi:large subunit ribosomal protein L21
MYVIVETGGKQYRLQQGETVRVERLDGEAGGQVTLASVLAASTDQGLQVGRPTLADATVTATIVRQGRGPKIHIYKYKRRKGYHKKIGHRQDFTELRIDRIALPGVSEPPAQAAATEPAMTEPAESVAESAPVESAVEPGEAAEPDHESHESY